MRPCFLPDATPRKQLTTAQKLAVGGRQKWTCHTCHKTLGSHMIFDHIVPLWQGGTNHLDNLCALCLTCDAEKTRRDKQRYFAACQEGVQRTSRYFDPGSAFYNIRYVPLEKIPLYVIRRMKMAQHTKKE